MIRKVWVGLIGLLLVVSCLGGATAFAAGYNVGQHLHVGISNMPVDGFPIARAPYTFHVTLKAHDQTGRATSFRVNDYNDIRKQVPISLGPCTDCSLGLDFTADFSTWSVGRHELRWTVNVPSNDDGNRQFTTSRTQVCISSCSPNVSGRPTPFSGGGSWYLSQYATVYDLSPDTAHRPGGTITVRAAQDATGACAFLNPDFHHGSAGTELGCWTGQSNHAVQIPASAVPGDHLVLIGTRSDGNAGVYNVPLGNATPRATYAVEVQSWWSKGGIVFPSGGPVPTPTPTVAPTPTPLPSPVLTPSPTPLITPSPVPSVCVP